MFKNSILFGFILAITGCEEKMDIEIEGKKQKKLVVEGCITSDTMSHSVTLSWTTSFFTLEARDMETGATVTISDGDQVFQLDESEPGIYKTAPVVYGIPGNTYTLDVVTRDGQHFTASETMPGVIYVDSVTQSGNYNHFDFTTNAMGYGYDILYHGPEPAGSGDYYLWNLYMNNELYNDTIFESMFVDDAFVDGNYIKNFPVYFIHENDVQSDSVLVTLESLTITRGYYSFIIGLMLETVWRGSPWDGPPANVETNIKPNGMGYFYAAGSSKESIFLEKKPRMD
ncbi:MAG: DUF4249 domain-containing protein [Bacteroidota bacterium]